MKINISQLRQIIKEEVALAKKGISTRKRLSEARDPVSLIAQFAEENNVEVEDVHALWDWYNKLIQQGKLPSPSAPETKLYYALLNSPLGLSSSDIAASIRASGGAAKTVSGPK